MSRRQSPVTAGRDDASGSTSSLLWPARSVGSGAGRLDLDRIFRSIEEVLTVFVADKVSGSRAEEPGLEALLDAVGDFISAPGKRIRPLMCVLGWYAAGGTSPVPPVSVLRVAACLEIFHAFALMHDDVMDGSDQRRGRPSLHRTLAAHHPGRPGADRLGVNAAILAGDLVLVWSDELLTGTPMTPEQIKAVLPVVHRMRRAIATGQYLDLVTTGHPTDSLSTALRIARYKTAQYTVEGPLQIGAALAGADQSLLHVLSTIALPLGEAFQLRDDLLGTFGDPRRTGKPALDDLREGKHTALLACALRRADRAGQKLLLRTVGAADLDARTAARVRGLLEECGARQAVEDLIQERHHQALERLNHAHLPATAAFALRDLIQAVHNRTA
ncbi:polyprenyl synthetase family protein [Streptomyces sp. NPDC006656]|uniref:polyprenyl synthetase family protein n=1 Tax=Streptomyces sp. NPDC006656 TaxID=3156899 RepID=UPI0034542028